MGLWLKKEDGTLVEVSGGGAGGSFDGEHVLTGDPGSPPEGWAAGQLLYDGWEDTGDGSEPHDHDYLPLAGGTLTGDLTVDGNADLKINAPADFWQAGQSGSVFNGYGMVGGTQGSYAMSMTANGYRNKDNKWTSMGVDGESGATQIDLLPTGKFYVRTSADQPANENAPVLRFSVTDDMTKVNGDLQVVGLIDGKLGPVPDDFWAKNSAGTVFTAAGMVGGTQGSDAMSMTCNGYRNSGNKWTSLGLAGAVGATEIDLTPTGKFYVRTAPNYPTGSASNPTVRFAVTESGPTFRAMPSKTRTVDDILERAETAEFPNVDDEGVTPMDGHDEVPLFEVVSALLAKVKEQSEQIAALTVDVQELKGA